MNNKLLTSFKASKTAFLDPIFMTEMKYVTLKAPQRATRLYFHLVQSFDRFCGWAFVFTSMSFLLVARLFNWCRNRLATGSKENFSLSQLMILMVGIQSSVGVDMKRLRSTQQRILFCSLLISSLILCNAFQGTIVSHFTHPARRGDIDTLEDLLASDFNLTAFTVFSDMFRPNKEGTNINAIQRRLFQRQKIDAGFTLERLKQILSQPKQAVMSEPFLNS